MKRIQKMNLRNKKQLAAKTLNIGKSRILFIESRKDEIKEAITKQDIRDLVSSGAIKIKEKKGRKKIKEKKRSRGPGKIKKKIKSRKKDYVIMTRKLRKYSKESFIRGEITKDELKEIRKKIRNKEFKSQKNLKEYVGGLKR